MRPNLEERLQALAESQPAKENAQGTSQTASAPITPGGQTPFYKRKRTLPVLLATIGIGLTTYLQLTKQRTETVDDTILNGPRQLQ